MLKFRKAALVAAPFLLLFAIHPALADMATDAATAVQGSASSALTVGSAVVAGVASLVVVGLIIAVVKKL